MQIVQVLSYRYKNKRSVAFKIRQNPFRPGLCPGPRWGSSRRSPRPLSRLQREHPSPYLTPLGTYHLRRSLCVPPQKSSQIYACVPAVDNVVRILSDLRARCFYALIRPSDASSLYRSISANLMKFTVPLP